MPRRNNPVARRIVKTLMTGERTMKRTMRVFGVMVMIAGFLLPFVAVKIDGMVILAAISIIYLGAGTYICNE